MTFNDLGLSQALLKAINQKGYSTPTAIQEKAIPHVLKGKDVLAAAQTGTGKTAGFALPILQLISQGENVGRRTIKALVLTPTRELAAQVEEEIRDYSKFLSLKSTVIFGGVKANRQIAILRKGVDILVATPGRLLDLEQQGELKLNNIEFFVLDEADRMLDMGFQRDINRIMHLLPKKRQTLLFSATFSKEIKQLANSLLYQAISVEATPENTTAERVDHQVYFVDKGRKAELAVKLIKEGDWSQVLIFTRTKHMANRLSKKLDSKGISSNAIHGNKSQNQRTSSLQNFKDGSVRVLVATDIAARGLDIPLLPYVINYELPNVPEDYVHRIGRTGRAGESGDAISFVNVDELEYLRDIEKLLDQKIPSTILPGFEPTDVPDPSKGKKNHRSGRQSRGPKQGGGKRSPHQRKKN